MNELEILKIDKGHVNNDFILDRITLRVKYNNSNTIDFFRIYNDYTIKWFMANSSIEIEVEQSLIDKIIDFLNANE